MNNIQSPDTPFWVDKHGRAYRASEIDDRYLANIGRGIPNGKYAPSFLNPSLIEGGNQEAALRLLRIYNECERRGIFTDGYCAVLRRSSLRRVLEDSRIRNAFDSYVVGLARDVMRDCRPEDD